MKPTYKFIFILAILLFAGAASAQKRVDVIFTTDNDTIYGVIHAELYGMIQYYPEGDYKLKTIDYRNINRIVLNKYNSIYLNHLIDKDGYIRSNYKPSGSQEVSQEAPQQQVYVNQISQSDSILYSDSAMVAMLAAAGTELVAFKNEYYAGMKQILGGTITTILGGGFASYLLFFAPTPELAIAGLAVAAVGVIVSVAGVVKTIVAVKRAGQAGKILQGAEKFYFPHVMD